MDRCKISLSDDEILKIKEIVKKHENTEGKLIPILHEVQDFYGYLPKEVVMLIANETNISPTEIYGVATFYSRFTTKPVGKYKISVCLGTACYVKGAEKILEEVKKQLGIENNETTCDGLFSINSTRCVGACGLAPVMMINNDVYGKVIVEDVKNILDKYRK